MSSKTIAEVSSGRDSTGAWGGRWSRTVALLGSRGFLAVVLVAFAVQSSWVAMVARTSVYDEEYHLAVIRLFTDQWLPVIQQQPDGVAVGDVERYPSFLYHYLMSFPMRWSEALTGESGVVLLRILTVLLVTWGLFVWREVVRELGGSAAIANVTVLVVACSPLLVFVSATVNYDNLLFLLTAAFVLASVRLYRRDEVDLSLWVQLITFGSLAAVTKYAFLPIGGALLLCVVVRQVGIVRAGGLRGSWSRWRDGMPITRVRRWAALVLLVVAVGLVLERYVGNLVRFGTPLPDCADVQTVETCLRWGPWGRNYRWDEASPDVALSLGSALAFFSGTWLPQMLWQGNAIGVIGDGRAILLDNGPHAFGSLIAWGLPAVVVVLLLSVPALRRVRGALPLLVVFGFYLAVLFGQNLLDYLRLGQAVGVHSRYVFLVLPVVLGIALIGVSRLLADARGWKLVLLCAFVVASTQGGGIVQFLHQTTPAWWSDRPALVAVQEQLGRVTERLVLPDDLVRDARTDPKGTG